MIRRETIVNVVLVVIAAFLASLFLPEAVGLVMLGAGCLVVAMIIGDCLRSLLARRLPSPSYVDLMLHRTHRRPSRPSDLARLERVIGYRVFSPRDFDYLLKARLARLVEYKLLANHAIDMRRQPGAARAALSDDLWGAVGPEETPADFPHRIDSSRVAMLVKEIEEL